MRRRRNSAPRARACGLEGSPRGGARAGAAPSGRSGVLGDDVGHNRDAQGGRASSCQRRHLRGLLSAGAGLHAGGPRVRDLALSFRLCHRQHVRRAADGRQQRAAGALGDRAERCRDRGALQAHRAAERSRGLSPAARSGARADRAVSRVAPFHFRRRAAAAANLECLGGCRRAPNSGRARLLGMRLHDHRQHTAGETAGVIRPGHAGRGTADRRRRRCRGRRGRSIGAAGGAHALGLRRLSVGRQKVRGTRRAAAGPVSSRRLVFDRRRISARRRRLLSSSRPQRRHAAGVGHLDFAAGDRGCAGRRRLDRRVRSRAGRERDRACRDCALCCAGERGGRRRRRERGTRAAVAGVAALQAAAAIRDR